jgi:hypothetical protein
MRAGRWVVGPALAVAVVWGGAVGAVQSSPTHGELTTERT